MMALYCALLIIAAATLLRGGGAKERRGIGCILAAETLNLSIWMQMIPLLKNFSFAGVHRVHRRLVVWREDAAVLIGVRRDGWFLFACDSLLRLFAIILHAFAPIALYVRVHLLTVTLTRPINNWSLMECINLCALIIGVHQLARTEKLHPVNILVFLPTASHVRDAEHAFHRLLAEALSPGSAGMFALARLEQHPDFLSYFWYYWQGKPDSVSREKLRNLSLDGFMVRASSLLPNIVLTAAVVALLALGIVHQLPPMSISVQAR